MADLTRALLIGTGFIGRVHAACLEKCTRARLSHVYDIDGDSADVLAGRHGAEASTTLEAALEAGCDFAIIATPTATHGDIARACIRSGISFLCEKPIDTDLGSAVETLAAATTAGLKSGLAFNRRFDAQHAALKAHVDAGAVGAIELMVLTSRTQAPPPVQYVAGSGGQLRDKGAHFFDLACWISGDRPVSVYADGDCLFEPDYGRHGDVDTAALTLRMAGGAFCQMNFSRRTGYGYDERIEIVGSEGMVQSRMPVPVDVALYRGDTIQSLGGHQHWYSRAADTYPAQLDAFLDHLEGSAPFPGLEDGLVAEAIALAAEQSMGAGAAVPVRYDFIPTSAREAPFERVH